MNKHIAESDLATPKVTTGPIMGSRKIYARPDAAPDLKVPLREIALDASSGEPPFRSTIRPALTPIPMSRSIWKRVCRARASNG